MFRNCLLAAVSASILLGTGCGSSDKPSPSVEVQAPSLSEQILGKWVFDPDYLEILIREELAKGGIDVNMIPEEDFAAIMQSAVEAIDIHMVFEDNGNVVVANKVEDADQSFSASWAVEDGRLTIEDPDGETVEASIKEGMLYISMPVGTEGVQEIRLVKDEG